MTTDDNRPPGVAGGAPAPDSPETPAPAQDAELPDQALEGPSDEPDAEPAGAGPAEPPPPAEPPGEASVPVAVEPAGAADPPTEEQPDEQLRLEPAEPGTTDPAAAVAAPPLLDPAAGQDAAEPETSEAQPASAEPGPTTGEPQPTAGEPGPQAVADEPAPQPAQPAAEEEPASHEPAAEPAELERAPAAPPDPAWTGAADEQPASVGSFLQDVEVEPGPADTDTDAATVAAAPEDIGPDASPRQLTDDDTDAGVPVLRSARGLLTALVATVVVLAALTAFLAVRSVSTRGGGGVEDARQDALAAARSAARIVFSYDYRHLDKDFAAGKAVTTGEFAKEYQRTTSKLVDDVAPRYKAVVVADISDAAVVDASKGQVVTLVFLNQQSTSTLNAGSKITQSRLEMTMVRRGDRWLVSKIRAF